MNQFLNDHFSYEFALDLKKGSINENTRVSELKKRYDFDRIKSDLGIKHTLVDRELKDVFFSEYMPLTHRKVEGIRHLNLDDEIKDEQILQ